MIHLNGCIMRKLLFRDKFSSPTRNYDIFPSVTKKIFKSTPENIEEISVNKKIFKVHPEKVRTSRVTKRIFKANPERLININEPSEKVKILEETMGPRKNPLGIQMLSKSMYDQIFLEGSKDNNHFNQHILEQSKKELLKHEMKSDEKDFLSDVNFKIPPLRGKNIEEHFKTIAEEQLKPYKGLILELIKNIPAVPKSWVFQEGWTKYTPGKPPEKVPFPPEKALVFDVEVCVKAGKAPVLATAVSNKAWYSWVSPSLIDGTTKPDTTHQYNLDALIPIESDVGDKGSSNVELNNYQKQPKVIIGHNVSYDRARIKEQYWLKKTGTRFVDTMSLHVCVSGLTSYQRTVVKSEKFLEEDESWRNNSSLNNLVDVYKLYCDKELSKETRDIFVHGTMQEIKDDFHNLMTYCSGDVIATYEILQQLFPLFLERFPHPVTLAGMLELGTAYLPINQNWNRYISESEQCFEDLEGEGRLLLARRADQACQLLHNEEYKKDIWLWDQDWEVKNLRLKQTIVKTIKEVTSVKKTVVNTITKALLGKSRKSRKDRELLEDEDVDDLEEKFKSLLDGRERLPIIRTLLPGYPNWYRKLCTKPDSAPDWVPGPTLISTSMKITPKLLSLTWEGYPLHHIKEKGWGFLIPFSDDVGIERRLPLEQLLEKCPLLTNKDPNVSGGNFADEIYKTVENHLMKKEYYARLKKDKTGGLYHGTGVWCNTEIEDCCWFFKLPHKDGASHNVGNPLAKDFLNKFSENVLAGDAESAELVLTIARKLSYWRNNRDRIMQQMVVWLDDEWLPRHLRDKGYVYGAIVPQVVVCGTLTRRAMEPTWMTASNAHRERIGSELRAMVQAPPGYNIVGADVDSQELWIASVLGDAQHAGLHGATPFGWMTLSGTKSKGTDMHSVTAKAVGISRDHAKVINYARIYGAGQNFAERLLKQFNPSMSEAEARSKAQKMFTLTKGKKIFFLKPEHLQEFPDEPYGKWQAFQMARSFGKTVDSMFYRSKWVGGTESAMFNRLEEIANSAAPVTPFLGGRLSRALEPSDTLGLSDKYLPTRVNWVVQSGAVDFLHLMLVCMRWIMGDRVRFCISFHDEVRYLVPETHKYQAALALHVTNLLTRSFCSYRLGLEDLPQSVAFFSSVEVDSVLRKECKHDCETPSNPHGLEKGYGIQNGESLDIYEAVKKVGAESYSDWWSKSSKRNVESNKTQTRLTRSNAR